MQSRVRPFRGHIDTSKLIEYEMKRCTAASSGTPGEPGARVLRLSTRYPWREADKSVSLRLEYHQATFIA